MGEEGTECVLVVLGCGLCWIDGDRQWEATKVGQSPLPLGKGSMTWVVRARCARGALRGVTESWVRSGSSREQGGQPWSPGRSWGTGWRQLGWEGENGFQEGGHSY